MVDKSEAKRTLRELALFAGAGGGILGGRLLGWETICAVECEWYAANILAQRQNDGSLNPFPIWSDVRTFDGRPWRGIVDVVSGGFPCQDISCSGKGAGLAGARSGLWSEFARIIAEVEPSYCFIENSPLLVSRGMEVVLQDLAEMGFDVQWGCIGAKEVGLPHNRQRIWLVASHPERGEKWEESCSRKTRRVGGVVKPLERDEYWEDALTRLRGMGNGLARAVDRTDRIRNGQVPAVAATAWNILSQRLQTTNTSTLDGSEPPP